MMSYHIQVSILKLKASYMLNVYKFKHWMFSWHVDAENDIVFSVAKRIHFVKYKEHTIVQFGKREYAVAPKYVLDK